MNTNTKEVPKAVKPAITDIVICGVGAAGSNVLQHLLYSYPMLNYTVVDFDKVEARNWEAGTQPYTKIDLNRPKTQAMQRIALALKEKRIATVNSRMNSTKDISGLVAKLENTLFVDAFDNAVSRNLFLGLPKKANVLHVGFSAVLCGEAVWNEVFTPMHTAKADATIDVCQMTLARPFIFALTALAATNISKFLETGVKENLYFDKYLTLRKF